MITPYLEWRHGERPPVYPHEALVDALSETGGVVIFHEQVLRIIDAMTRCGLSEAERVRRQLSDDQSRQEAGEWFRAEALDHGYDGQTVDQVWEVLESFGGFGFCKAHAAAFAIPTYQSAWLKRHYPAAFYAGVLTHDPGMYPKRVIVGDARLHGIPVLPVDVNASAGDWRVAPAGELPGRADRGAAVGLRAGLNEVKGISEAEVTRIVAGQPYASVRDFWERARVSRPVVERLVLVGAFDSVYGIGGTRTAGTARAADPGQAVGGAPAVGGALTVYGAPAAGEGRVSRRDLLARVGALDRSHRTSRSPRAARRARRAGRPAKGQAHSPLAHSPHARSLPRLFTVLGTANHQKTDTKMTGDEGMPGGRPGKEQMLLGLEGEQDGFAGLVPAGELPELTAAERVEAELDILGIDLSQHVRGFYEELIAELGVIRSRDLRRCRGGSRVLVTGVKIATQTPAIRSGQRIIFVTLDDATGPVDLAFFESVQDRCAARVFGSWLLVVAGRVRRAGGSVSINGTECWDLAALAEIRRAGGIRAVRAAMAAGDVPDAGAARGTGRVPGTGREQPGGVPKITYSSGFTLSPYAETGSPGSPVKDPPRKLWHASPGSSGGWHPEPRPEQSRQ
jgi:error-prone DNA polymerase